MVSLVLLKHSAEAACRVMIPDPESVTSAYVTTSPSRAYAESFISLCVVWKCMRILPIGDAQRYIAESLRAAAAGQSGAPGTPGAETG